MRHTSFKVMVVMAFALATSGSVTGDVSTATSGSGPTFKHIGKLAFGPDGRPVCGRRPGSLHHRAAARPADGRRSAGHQGRAGDRSEDCRAPRHRRQEPPRSPTWWSTRRRATPSSPRCAAWAPAPRRCCCAWTARARSTSCALDQVRYSRIGLPNPPPAETPLVLGEDERFPVANYPDKVDPKGLMGVQTITHMAFIDGKLYVSGLSNEEFASKMRVIPYPFATADERHERRDLPRLARPARDVLAGLHLRALHDRWRAVDRRQLPVHAARQVPGLGAEARQQGAGHDDRRVRQPQSARST